MNEQTEQLLQEIQQAVHCFYLSDLCRSILDNRAKDLISQIPDDRYTISAWNAAASYIRSEKFDCNTVREAKEKIIGQR